MKRIELYHSMSGDVHLYEIDFEQPAMTEIARGKFGKELGFGYLLGENEESVSFYQSVNDKWRVVPVHTTDVGVLFGEIVYCRKDVWYAYLDGKEILLGERKRLDAVSFFRCGSSSYESYFIRSGEETFVLSIITPQGKLMQKEYPGSLKENRQVILAPLGDGCFDAYQEARQLIGLTEKGKPYFKDDEGNIYFWSESKYCWKRLPLRRCVVIADNAVVNHLSGEQGCGVRIICINSIRLMPMSVMRLCAEAKLIFPTRNQALKSTAGFIQKTAKRTCLILNARAKAGGSRLKIFSAWVKNDEKTLLKRAAFFEVYEFYY